MDCYEYKQRIDGLAGSIHNAAMFFAAWDALQSEDKEVVAAMNLYKGFFRLASAALNNSMLMELSKAFDVDTRTASFPNVLSAAQKSRKEFAPEFSDADFAEASELISQGEELLTDLRNKRLAHFDIIGSIASQQLEVPYDEFKHLLDKSKKLLNQFSHAFDGSSWGGAYYSQIQDATMAVQRLAVAERRQLFGESQSIISPTSENESGEVH